MKNIILQTDSYKLGHWNQYPKNTEKVYSYFESRKGAKWDETVFFGLQYILKKNLTKQVSHANIDEAVEIASAHFGNDKIFNEKGWRHIVDNHNGYLPVRIKCVPEGTPVLVNNVMLTVENTDPKCWWLTNFLESQLTHVWYSSTVATLSREVKKNIKRFYEETADHLNLLDFKLHDFGYRGVSSNESADIGGAAHLVSFLGTDTVPALKLLHDYYSAEYAEIAYSVPATEHSIMTAEGPDGEQKIVERLLKEYPTGILSIVSDSYDIYNFVDNIIGINLKNQILKRNGITVIRPDSISPRHKTPEEQMVWIAKSLWKSYGGVTNKKGYNIINPKVRILWGDGIDIDGINKILSALKEHKFSVENVATFGMGGGLLQRINRDTQRFAFKCSAQYRNGKWIDVYKDPTDKSKASKKGRLKLICNNGKFETRPIHDNGEDCLQTVFENGKILKEYTLAEVRENAKIV